MKEKCQSGESYCHQVIRAQMILVYSLLLKHYIEMSTGVTWKRIQNKV